MPWILNQFFSHIHQRWIFPLKVAGQQSKNTPIFYGTIKLFKALAEAFFIQRNIRDQMFAFTNAACAAAGKYFLWRQVFAHHLMRFKKIDWKKRNVGNCWNSWRTHTHQLYVFSINLAVSRLILKRIKGSLFKGSFGDIGRRKPGLHGSTNEPQITGQSRRRRRRALLRSARASQTFGLSHHRPHCRSRHQW